MNICSYVNDKYIHIQGHVKEKTRHRPKRGSWEAEHERGPMGIPRGLSIIDGADEETRTLDPRITSAVLYQLSYIGMRAALTRENVV